MLDEFLELLKSQAGRAIYVWGGSGECLADMDDPEGWITRKERTSSNAAKNAKRAIALFRERIYEGMDDCRAFDCSGLVSWALIQIGLRSKRTDCDGLWAKCKPLSEPRNGALVFRVSGGNSQDETHVGVCLEDTYVIHSKGRDVGVVMEKYKASYWHKCGWYQGLLDDAAQPSSVIVSTGETRLMKVTNPYMRGSDVAELQKRLLALGYSIGRSGADGIYGNDTASAVLELQTRAQNIRICGELDERTRSLLGL